MTLKKKMHNIHVYILNPTTSHCGRSWFQFCCGFHTACADPTSIAAPLGVELRAERRTAQPQGCVSPSPVRVSTQILLLPAVLRSFRSPRRRQRTIAHCAPRSVLGKGRGCEAVEHRSTGTGGLLAACPHPSALSWPRGPRLAPGPAVGLWDVGHADALRPHLRVRTGAVQHVAVHCASLQIPHKETYTLRKLPRGFFFLALLPWERIHPMPFFLRLGLLLACVSVPSLCLGSPCPLWFSPLGDEVLDLSLSVLGRIRLLSHLLPASPHPTLETGTAGMAWQDGCHCLG